MKKGGKMEKDFRPLSKSWAIRQLFLDMIYGGKTGYKVIRYFHGQSRTDLSKDVRAAFDCALNYLKGRYVFPVGNAGTVCRFTIYIMHGKKYLMHMGKQLRERMKKMQPVPANLTDLSVAELLRLGTSQYASAALLLGAKPTGIKNLHPKCKLAMEARKVYFENKGRWVPRYDEVILGQLNNFLHGKEIKDPIAEDYPCLRAYNLTTREEGTRRWPELADHECNRLKVMERICKRGFDRYVRVPKDHRVIMAVALRQKSLGLPIRLDNRKEVAKSWPTFWKWLRLISEKERGA